MDKDPQFDMFSSEFDFLLEESDGFIHDHCYSKQYADDKSIENGAIFAEEVTDNILQDFMDDDFLGSDVTVKCEENERFSNLADEELNDIAAANSEESTKKQTKWAVLIFKGESFICIAFSVKVVK